MGTGGARELGLTWALSWLQVPLGDASVDVAVFCLSLMGTNLQEILEEANRLLRPG